MKEKKVRKSVTATPAMAGRGKDSRQRSVFVKTEQQCDDDGQSAAAKDIRAENTVFRAEDK